MFIQFYNLCFPKGAFDCWRFTDGCCCGRPSNSVSALKVHTNYLKFASIRWKSHMWRKFALLRKQILISRKTDRTSTKSWISLASSPTAADVIFMVCSGGEHQWWVVYWHRVAAECSSCSSSGRRWMSLLDAGSISVCCKSGRRVCSAVSRAVLSRAALLSGDLCDLWGLWVVQYWTLTCWWFALMVLMQWGEG